MISSGYLFAILCAACLHLRGVLSLSMSREASKISSEPITAGAIISVGGFSNEKFAVGRVLHGGMGIVYQIVPVRPIGRTMALKTYIDAADTAKFDREARLWISLGTHPNIAHAHWYGKWCDQPAIIADWYPVTLMEAKVSQWTTDRILNLALQMVEGLEFAFKQVGLIHQDIKPSNVLVDELGAPRIADFGVSLLARPLSRGIQAGSDKHRMMRVTVSSGSLAGTPIYMAPELFSAAKPSVQTDIFSLGITLYELLTAEHPYFDFAKGGFSSVLRNGPLDRVLRERGQDVQPLISLIRNALELEPERRPRSYRELLNSAGLRGLNGQVSAQGPEDIVAQVILHRNQGRFDEAGRLLDSACEINPRDPLLLNAKGCLLIVLKEIDRGIEALSFATSVLESHRGQYKGRVYLDPPANLSRQLLLRREFDQAEKVLARCWDWIERDGSFSPTHYPEFGWWFLYKGRFRECCVHLQQTYRFKIPEPESLRWMTLAAVLGNDLDVWASEIAGYYMQVPIDIGSALCVAVIADSVGAESRKAMLQRVSEEIDTVDLLEASKALGLSGRELQSPLLASARSSILRSLDYSVTGGKYHGTIR